MGVVLTILGYVVVGLYGLLILLGILILIWPKDTSSGLPDIPPPRKERDA